MPARAAFNGEGGSRKRRLEEVLRFPCQVRYASVARRAVAAVLDSLEIDEKQRSDLVMAVGEGIGTTLKHATDSASYIEIRIKERGSRLRIDIENDGAAFDPRNRLSEDFRGFSTTIMRHLVDSVAFFNDGRLLRLEVRVKSTACGLRAFDFDGSDD